MSKNKQLYDKEEKSGEVKKLKAHIRKLEHEIARLKSQLKTYDRAFSKNLVFLKEKTNDLSLEELLAGAEQELSLKEIKSEKKQKFADLQERWKCHSCNEGVLRLIIIPGLESNRYFRKCSMCEKRTNVQEYTENVEGIK